MPAGKVLLVVALIHTLTLLSSASRERACGDGYPSARLQSGYCAFTFFRDSLLKPRGIVVDHDGDGAVLIVDRSQGRGRILALRDSGREGGVQATSSVILTTNIKLTHGIALKRGWLYASSQDEVWRWRYVGGKVEGQPERIVQGIPKGGHTTRTLVFHKGDLLVQCGSLSNVDDGPERAVIKVVRKGEGKDLDWEDLEVWVSGLRNTVGLTVDEKGRLWGVENGADSLTLPDVGDVHNDNPCEELNLVQKGKFYGYPFAFSEYRMPSSVSRGRTGQFLQGKFHKSNVKFMGDIVNDTWVQDENKVVRPTYCMPAHWAPLGIAFENARSRGGKYSFPENHNGSAYVFSHGSWNANPPVGRLVARIDFKGDSLLPRVKDDPVILFGHQGKEAAWAVRPVDGAFARDGSLVFTSDATGEVIAIRNFNNLTGTGSPDPGNVVCFPGHALVQLEGGQQIPMSKLELGDRILTRKSRFSDVYLFGHRSLHETHFYLRICATNSVAHRLLQCLHISDEHYLYTPTGLQTAGSILPGDFIQNSEGSFVPVASISRYRATGLFSPVTVSGDLVVDGFVVSAYTAVANPRVTHWALAPLRFMYRLRYFHAANLGGWLYDGSRAGILSLLGIPRGPQEMSLRDVEL